ncbi:uncharacterized protein [Mytilus edulis]|uniref:uncharacterized protein n=1 Tax=Mytilus edulis TaxID=6550 RepID=UPI0039EEE1EE
MSDENKIGFAQCPIDEASCSSVKEQEPRSLREQIKSHEESTMTLMEEKQEKEDENRDYDAEHDEYENIPESPDIAANGAHSVHERQMKPDNGVFLYLQIDCLTINGRSGTERCKDIVSSD